MSTYAYSKISLYTLCPLQYKDKYIDKIIPFEQSIHTERGSFFHKLIEEHPNKDFEFKFRFHSKEDRIRMEEYFDKEVANDDFFQRLYKYKHEQEKRFYTDSNLINVQKKDSIFNGIIDFIGIKNEDVLIVDWKTGKTIASPKQLEFYAMYVLSQYPNIDKVYVVFYYIDTKVHIKQVFYRNQLKLITEYWLKLVDEIENCVDFKPKFNKSCAYCHRFGTCNPINLKRK
jgi:hypothetical protein